MQKMNNFLQDSITLYHGSEYTFFHLVTEENAFCSNWYISVFKEDTLTFTSMEQYLMYKKAMLFGDIEIAKQILACDNPSDIKKMGRMVKTIKKVYGQQTVLA